MHRRLYNDSQLEFPIFADLIDSGVKGYLGFPLQSVTGEINAISFGTTMPGGFGSADVDVLKSLSKQWMLAMEPYQAHEKLRTAAVYLPGP